MRSSIAVAAELAAEHGQRLLLVLGEMRELGALSASEHQALGRFAAEGDVVHVFGVGGDARFVTDEVVRAGKRATFAEDADRAISLVSAGVEAGDVVLVKGSRSIATEKIVRALVRGGEARVIYELLYPLRHSAPNVGFLNVLRYIRFAPSRQTIHRDAHVVRAGALVHPRAAKSRSVKSFAPTVPRPT
jgi:hypothetical protein